MRILYVSDVYFPRVNGVSTSIRTFRRELQALGHEVMLVAPAYPHCTMPDEAGILRLASRAIPLDPEDRLMQAAALRRIPAHLGARTFDLVHIQTPFAAHYAGLRIAGELNVPCVATYHTFFEEYLYHYVPFAPRPLMRAAARAISRRQGNQVDALVVPSRAMLAALTKYGVRSPMTVLPTGIPLDELAPGDGAAFRRRHGILPDRPLLVHVGRVAFEKNIDFVLRMFAHVRAMRADALLVIAGEGPALPHLKKLAKRLGIAAQVHFIGYLDRAGALLDCFSAADVFVFASRTETQGLVLLEALALQVPVVAIAEMGTLDILENGRGALIAPNDEHAFAGTVGKLLDSLSLRRELAAAGRQHAMQWDAAPLARQLADFYTEVIAKGAARAGTASAQAAEHIHGRPVEPGSVMHL